MKNKAELIKDKVAVETKLTAEVVELLHDFEFSGERERMKFSSLYAFCVDYLNYSKGSAHRRIQAVDLLKRDNSVREKLQTGELNLSNAAKVESICKAAEKQGKDVSTEELFQAASGPIRTSERELDKIAETYGVETKRPSPKADALLERLLALRSHKNPGLTKDELICQLANEALDKEDPARKEASPGAGEKYQEKRYVTPKLEAFIWQRDEGQCTEVNRLTKERCRETHFLEIDHIVPFAKGGLTKASNLRLLCRSHNQQHAKAHGLRRPS